jgi:hypothetical protein
MTAAEIYESVTNGGASDFASVVNILDRHGPWRLIGGLAVNCYVEPVYTVDADIVVVAERLEAIVEDLRSAFPHREVSAFAECKKGTGRFERGIYTGRALPTLHHTSIEA